jgi:endonuclease YncB( thermonuclease family)
MVFCVLQRVALMTGLLAAVACPATGQTAGGNDVHDGKGGGDGGATRLTVTRQDGPIDIVSGESLWIGTRPLRLNGILAPKPKIPCLKDGRDQGCATKARAALVSYAESRAFGCTLLTTGSGRPRLRYNKYLAYCFAGKTDVNQELVAQGLVLAAAGADGDRYRAVEAEARAALRGLHATDYEGRVAPPPPPSPPWWMLIYIAAVDLAKQYPLAGIVLPWLLALAGGVLLVAIRWRARRQIARLQFELGKSQGLSRHRRNRACRDRSRLPGLTPAHDTKRRLPALAQGHHRQDPFPHSLHQQLEL